MNRFPIALVRMASLVGLFLCTHLNAFQGTDSYSSKAVADVVVIVDTSTSMREPGMDPERTSLLVAQLLADIVPGDLAVIRLLDLATDSDLLPSRATGQKVPCAEDANRQCDVVEPVGNWEELARDGKLGALIRRTRGDADFKRRLDSHLEQRINNSKFSLAFHAASGVFDQRPAASAPQTVVWLSDGRSSDEASLRQVIRSLVAQGVGIEPIVFGRGDTRIAEQSGLKPTRVTSPSELMKAFAGAFRRMVRAPYEIDQVVSRTPQFEMKPHVDEAWIVVYGDASLAEVELQGPTGVVRADYAQGRLRGAGGYRAAYLEKPAAGTWTVRVQGGGGAAAYAVVQRSALTPVLLAPQQVLAGTSATLVVGIKAGLEGDLITSPDLLRGMSVQAMNEGRSVDLTAQDGGRFSGQTRFDQLGSVDVDLHAISSLVDRRGRGSVQVSGSFQYDGDGLEIDLGRLELEDESCRRLDLSGARHQGRIPFAMEVVRSLPGGHSLQVRSGEERLMPGGPALHAAPADPLELCLTTNDWAPVSQAQGELWVRFKVAGSDDPTRAVPIRLHWQVDGLTWWGRWGWLILLILALLLLAIIVAGFIIPQRFSGALALVFVPEREELDEQTPQPVKQWKGVGIGFYRDARAYLHPNYRLSGNAGGALAGLQAQRRGVKVVAGRGISLYRETLDGDWELVSAEGRRSGSGDVFRSGDSGPYFRISTRTGR